MFIKELECTSQKLEEERMFDAKVNVDKNMSWKSCSAQWFSNSWISGPFTFLFLNYLGPQRAFLCIGYIKYVEKAFPHIHATGKGGIFNGLLK